MDNPAVVDSKNPRLSWVNKPVTDKRNISQSAYRILVATSQSALKVGKADLWDSGKVKSEDSYLVKYNGAELSSAIDCYWSVMVWDENDVPSKWSKPSHWGMGLLNPSDWKAKWIGAPWTGEDPINMAPEVAGFDFMAMMPVSDENDETTILGSFEPGQTVEQVKEAESQKESFDFASMFGDGEIADMIKQDNKEVGIDTRKNAPMLRTNFNIKGKVSKAKVFVTSLGYFELFLNGKKVGNDVLSPNFTNYSYRPNLQNKSIRLENKFSGYRILYLSYDVTQMLKKGQNAIGAMISSGYADMWVGFGSPRLLCQMEITYADGSREIICSDENWKAHRSPILSTGIHDGEFYDAREEIADWAMVSCDESTWEDVAIMTAPTGKLLAHTSPTDRIIENLKPVSLVRNEDGSYEVDFGKEVSGWIKFDGVKAQAGDTLDINYQIDQPVGLHKYVFKDGRKASHAPKFTWYVFQKATISGVKELSSDMLTAQVVNTDVKQNATFESSEKLFEQINTIYKRSQEDNLHAGVSSDCPHRERLPYTGDGQIACVTMMYNYDATAFYTKWVADMRDSQNPETGFVPMVAPWISGGGGPAWGAAVNIIPWEFYCHYGDKKMLSDSFDAMAAQVGYMLKWVRPDGTMFCLDGGMNDTPNMWLTLGDWSCPYENPKKSLVHTFYLWRCADYTAKAAKALGKNSEFDYFREIADKTKKAFNDVYWDSENKTYGDYGSNIYALKIGVPVDRYEDVKATLREEIVVKNKGHLNTGMLASAFFFETLAENGMADIAYEAMSKRTLPSYGFWVESGSSTTWEGWKNGSHNHPMLGGGLTWFYRSLAGVYTDENDPGFRHIIIKPIPCGKDVDAKYSQQTPYGLVSSAVSYSGEDVSINVTIPVGCYATVYIPSEKSIFESGKNAEEAPGVTLTGHSEGYSILQVAQGTYSFTTAI